jgi:hypothetical protein
MVLDRKEEWLAARMEDLDYGYIDGTYRLNMQNTAAISTVSWISTSVAPAARAAVTFPAETLSPLCCTAEKRAGSQRGEPSALDLAGPKWTGVDRAAKLRRPGRTVRDRRRQMNYPHMG